MGDVIENNEPNPFVYLDIAIDEEKVGRIVIELFKNVCPKTAENFRVLCTGERGIGKLGKKLHFKGSIFHKAVPECLIQGGDITHFNGSGGESIYGTAFEDENFTIKHEFGGELSTANRGKPNTNNSQFCITTVPCSHLDGAHVVFGRVRKGMDVVKEIGFVKVGPKERPIPECKITDCGEFKIGDDWGINDNDETEDILPPYPSDWDKTPEELKEDSFVNLATVIKNSGNQFYKKGSLVDAIRKYKKALRYIKWYRVHLKKTGNLNKSALIKEIELHCNLNCALVKQKKGLYKESLEYSLQALRIDNQNVKALCRKARANFALDNYDLALEDFNLALTIAPDDKSIQNDIRDVKKAKSDYLKLEKITYARMFKAT